MAPGKRQRNESIMKAPPVCAKYMPQVCSCKASRAGSMRSLAAYFSRCSPTLWASYPLGVQQGKSRQTAAALALQMDQHCQGVAWLRVFPLSAAPQPARRGAPPQIDGDLEGLCAVGGGVIGGRGDAVGHGRLDGCGGGGGGGGRGGGRFDDAADAATFLMSRLLWRCSLPGFLRTLV